MADILSIFARKRQDLAELELFANICIRALQQASKAVEGIELQLKIADALGEPLPFESTEALEKAKEEAAKVAAFAVTQTSGGSPYLFSLCAVRLWALMEALVDELIVETMYDPTKCSDQDLLSRLKGPLVEFRAASAEEQAEFLAETLKQAVDAPLKLGVGRFEAVLAPVGLGGQVDESVRKALFELSQIRNVIVHKSGRADRRIIEACPWLALTRGGDVVVTDKLFGKFLSASYWYLLELAGRKDERDGKVRTSELTHAHSLLLKEIARLSS